MNQTIAGQVDAIMMTDEAYYAFIYRQTSPNNFQPVRCEISRERYYELLARNPHAYTEPGYVSFDLALYEAEVVDSEHQEWMDELDDQDAERPGLFH